MVTVSRLTNTIVAVDPRASNRKGCIIKRERTYNKKSIQGRTELKRMALFLLKHYEGNKAFITITTTQHITGATDSQLMATMGDLLRSRKYFGTDYTLVCERQRNTSDLHFHILANFNEVNHVDWKKLRQKVAMKFGIKNHPAVLQFDWLTDQNSHNLVANYMIKVAGYCSKESGKILKSGELSPNQDDAPYSSMFYCRTYSVSKSLRNEFRRVADRYEVKVNPHFLQQVKVNQLHHNDFYSVYKSNDKIFEQAIGYRANQVSYVPTTAIKPSSTVGSNDNVNCDNGILEPLPKPSFSIECTNYKVESKTNFSSVFSERWKETKNPNSLGERKECSAQCIQQKKINYKKDENCISSTDSRFSSCCDTIREPVFFSIRYLTNIGALRYGRQSWSGHHFNLSHYEKINSVSWNL